MGKGETIPWHYGLGWQIKQFRCENILVYFKPHHILIFSKYSNLFNILFGFIDELNEKEKILKIKIKIKIKLK
jgi:hypothetical protein